MDKSNIIIEPKSDRLARHRHFLVETETFAGAFARFRH